MANENFAKYDLKQDTQGLNVKIQGLAAVKKELPINLKNKDISVI